MFARSVLVYFLTFPYLLIEDCRLTMELKEVKRNMKAMDMMITFFRIRNFSSFSSLVSSFLETATASSALAVSIGEARGGGRGRLFCDKPLYYKT